jgi:hypothetical protein
MKMRKRKLSFIGLSVFLFLCLGLISASTAEEKSETATGVVFYDRNGNRVFDQGDRGLDNIRVSNGRDIVLTNWEGRYEIPVDQDEVIFVIKPEGWMPPVDENQLPQFYYVHKPDGSPDMRYPGVKPTGPLPESIDFPLYRQEEPEKFSVLFFGDTQPRNQKEIDYIAHDVIEELVGNTDARFGVTLGDLVFDDLSLFDSLNRTISLLGIPWYNVMGNHDLNHDTNDDRYSDETWERVYGPPYYSFDYGPVHFLVLDNIRWMGRNHPDPNAKSTYSGGLGEDQLKFIENNLALVPEEKLMVLLMHIPMNKSSWHYPDSSDLEKLFALIAPRSHSFSASAHTHTQEHKFIKKEDGRPAHHHMIAVTVCGSWWSGAPDENGIPHTTMRCGAPNGYTIVTFDGNEYSMEFKAARRPAEHQMNIYAPEVVDSESAGNTEVIANIFAGSEKSLVEMKFGQAGAWMKMYKENRKDPYFAAMKELEKSDNPPPGRKLPGLPDSAHTWVGRLPGNPPAGTHLIHVRTTDMFGRTYEDQRIIRVE